MTTMDVDEQGRHLEGLQFELQAAGYGTQQVPDGPTSVLLHVWHPDRRAHCLTLHATSRPNGEVVFRPGRPKRDLPDRADTAAAPSAIIDLARHALGDPR